MIKSGPFPGRSAEARRSYSLEAFQGTLRRGHQQGEMQAA
jgi:hypothetical protein